MTDETKFTEAEHIAILADRVKTETASLTAELDQLKNQLDVSESAKVAAEQRAADAEKALEDFKAEITEREAATARKDERVTKLKEVAAHLGEDFFSEETRVARICAMADDAFEAYAADLAAAAPKGSVPVTSVPRETAMAGAPAAPTSTTSAARGVLLGRFETQE